MVALGEGLLLMSEVPLYVIFSATASPLEVIDGTGRDSSFCPGPPRGVAFLRLIAASSLGEWVGVTAL